MAYKTLRDWSRGIISDNDSLDMPPNSASDLVNYRPSPGMLEEREKPKPVISSGLTSAKEFKEFVVYNGSSEDRFILVKDGTKLERFDYSGSPASYNQVSLWSDQDLSDGLGVADTVFDVAGNRPYFYQINNNIYITRAVNKDTATSGLETLWYGYITGRNFFNGVVGQTFSDYYLVDATLPVFDGSSPANHMELTAAGSGSLSGRYFVRCSFVVDGYQHAWHKDDDTINGEHDNYVDCVSSEEYIDITMPGNDTLAESANLTWKGINKRITGIDVWMAWAPASTYSKPTTAYYKCARVAIDDNNWSVTYLDSGKNTSTDITSTTAAATFDVDAAYFVAGDRIRIDAEVFTVTSVSGVEVTASRGTPAPHTAPKDVYIAIPQISPRVKLSSGGTSADFPANHEAYNTDDVRYSFEEEYHLTKNSLPGISSGYDVQWYSMGEWINGRHFVIRPNVEKDRAVWRTGSANYNQQLELPYDPRQTVLFSKINQPDAIDFMLDYIDLSTEEGDPCVWVGKFAGNLIVLKEHSMFVIALNNTGDSMEWTIVEHMQKYGSISRNGTAQGGGFIFFPGKDNVYLFDGRMTKAISKNAVRGEYLTQLGQVSDNEDIFSVYDAVQNRFIMYLPGNSVYCYIYDIDTQSFYKYQYNDTSGENDIRNVVIDTDLNLLAMNDSGTKVLHLETSGGTETAQTKKIVTQWIPLTDNPLEEVRLGHLMLDMNLSGGTYEVKVYVVKQDYGGGESPGVAAIQYSAQTAKSYRHVHYHEISEFARMIKVEVNVSTQTAEFYGMSIMYHPLGDEQ